MASSSPTEIQHDEAPRKRPRVSRAPSGPSARQKRDKYTVMACNECRKRKIKCSGEAPCRRCEKHELDCLYAHGIIEHGRSKPCKPKIEALEDEMFLLREQVDEIAASLRRMQKTNQHFNGSLETQKEVSHSSMQTSLDHIRRPVSAKPRFVGPTSSDYNFSMANNALQTMGIQTDEPDWEFNAESAGPSRCPSPGIPRQEVSSRSDPLLSVGMEESYRALEVYKEELSQVYPFIPVEKICQLVPSIFEYLQLGSSFIGMIDQNREVDKEDVNILKMIVASALILEGRGKSRISQILVDSIGPQLTTSLREVNFDLKELQVLTMTSIYYFLSDEPVLAWRTIGCAARIALEMGLHRKESLEQGFQDLDRRDWALRLFWCIYILDRRWSFGIGMPFVLQDSDIDPELPSLKNSDPYLECIVAYGRICSGVWNTVAGYGKKRVDNDTIAYLDFRIQQWLDSIPPQLQFLHPKSGTATENQSRGLLLLRVLLYIRGNHMRSFIHRHNILSVSAITKNLEGARLVIDIAKDTIRVLVHLQETSTLYESQQIVFNYFLVSAISAIFLAVCHAPDEFSQSCREEFYRALGLLSELSSHSYISRRLWKSVRGLQQIAPRLGLAPDRHLVKDTLTAGRQHPTTLPAIAETQPGRRSLHHKSPSNVASSAPFILPEANMTPTSGSSPSNIPDIFQIGNDLTHVFEALGSGFDTQERSNQDPDWMTEELCLLRNGGEVLRLFEGLL